MLATEFFPQLGGAEGLRRDTVRAGLGTAIAALVAAIVFPGVGLAADAADEATVESMFDVAFGIAVTSDYISRGISQTDGDPAIQGYAEFDYGIFYAGIWSSNVDFGTPDAEIDLSVGVRPETDWAAFDFGYVQYIYAADTSPTYGELYGIIEYYATDSFTVGGDIYIAPDYSQYGGVGVFAEGTLDYALPKNFGVSGALGYQGFESSVGLPDYWTWNAGVYWSWNDMITLDLRYVGSDLSDGECAQMMSRHACGNRFMATLSFDTAWSTLTGR